MKLWNSPHLIITPLLRAQIRSPIPAVARRCHLLAYCHMPIRHTPVTVSHHKTAGRPPATPVNRLGAASAAYPVNCVGDTQQSHLENRRRLCVLGDRVLGVADRPPVSSGPSDRELPRPSDYDKSSSTGLQIRVSSTIIILEFAAVSDSGVHLEPSYR